MNKAFFIIICLGLLSCGSLKVAENKNSNNLKSLGIEWDYSEKVDERYKPLVDSSIAEVIKEFNSEKHLFQVHRKSGRDKDKDYITLDFGKGKIVGKGGQIAGYAISAIGLIAAPAALVAAESPMLVAFYYFPQNHLDTKMSLSPSMSSDKSKDKKLISATGVLFSNRKKQVSKVVSRFSSRLKDVLLKIEHEAMAHS